MSRKECFIDEFSLVYVGFFGEVKRAISRRVIFERVALRISGTFGHNPFLREKIHRFAGFILKNVLCKSHLKDAL